MGIDDIHFLKEPGGSGKKTRKRGLKKAVPIQVDRGVKKPPSKLPPKGK